jgi:hypothetical protein
MTVPRKYNFHGKMRTVKEISEIAKVPIVTVYRRIRESNGNITDEMLSKPPKFRRRKFMFHGELQSLQTIASMLKMDVSALYKRLESTNGKVTETTFLSKDEYNKHFSHRLRSESGKLITEIAFESNLSYNVVYERFRRGGHRNDDVLGAKPKNYDEEYGIS